MAFRWWADRGPILFACWVYTPFWSLYGNVQFIFSVVTHCTLANCVASFNQAYSVSTKRTVSISYPFISFFWGFSSFGGCDTLSLLSFTISDEGYLSLYLSNTSISSANCSHAGDLLRAWWFSFKLGCICSFQGGGGSTIEFTQFQKGLW